MTSFFPGDACSGGTQSLRVAVVGAGIAGLTAAYRLKQTGFEVVVLERQANVGGRMTLRTENNIEYNTGARLVYSFSKDLLTLMNRLGLTSGILPVEQTNTAIRCNGVDHPAHLTPGPGILASPFVKLRHIPALMRMLVELLGRQFRRNPNDLAAGHLLDDQTMVEYLEARGLATIGRFLLEPVFRGTRGWRLQDVSPAFFMSTSAAMLRARPLNFRDGIGMLANRLAQQNMVVTGVEVTDIARVNDTDSDGCTITYRTAGETLQFRADIVVVAVEGSLAVNIIRNPSPEESRWFSAIRYNSGGVLHYQLNKQLPATLRFYGPGENKLISIFEIRPGPDASVHVLVHLSPEGVQKATEQGLEHDIERLLQGILPEIVVENRQHICSRFDQWIPNYLPISYPGYVAALREFRHRQSVNPGRCYYAGDYMAQALTGGACRSGKLTADTIIDHWGKS